MIVELAVGAGLVAAGVTLLKVIRSRGRDSKSRERQTVPKHEPPKRGPRGYQVGDVVLHLDKEFWLSASVSLTEEELVLRVFSTPGAGEVTHLIQLDPEALEIALVHPVEVPEGSLPIELPSEGDRYKLVRRGAASVERAGEHPPGGGSKTDYACFRSLDGKLLCVLDFASGTRLALAGGIVDPALLELLPAGDL